MGPKIAVQFSWLYDFRYMITW